MLNSLVGAEAKLPSMFECALPKARLSENQRRRILLCLELLITLWVLSSFHLLCFAQQQSRTLDGTKSNAKETENLTLSNQHINFVNTTDQEQEVNKTAQTTNETQQHKQTLGINEANNVSEATNDSNINDVAKDKSNEEKIPVEDKNRSLPVAESVETDVETNVGKNLSKTEDSTASITGKVSDHRKDDVVKVASAEVTLGANVLLQPNELNTTTAKTGADVTYEMNMSLSSTSSVDEKQAEQINATTATVSDKHKKNLSTSTKSSVNDQQPEKINAEAVTVPKPNKSDQTITRPQETQVTGASAKNQRDLEKHENESVNDNVVASESHQTIPIHTEAEGERASEYNQNDNGKHENASVDANATASLNASESASLDSDKTSVDSRINSSIVAKPGTTAHTGVHNASVHESALEMAGDGNLDKDQVLPNNNIHNPESGKANFTVSNKNQPRLNSTQSTEAMPMESKTSVTLKNNAAEPHVEPTQKANGTETRGKNATSVAADAQISRPAGDDKTVSAVQLGDLKKENYILDEVDSSIQEKPYAKDTSNTTSTVVEADNALNDAQIESKESKPAGTTNATASSNNSSDFDSKEADQLTTEKSATPTKDPRGDNATVATTIESGGVLGGGSDSTTTEQDNKAAQVAGDLKNPISKEETSDEKPPESTQAPKKGSLADFFNKVNANNQAKETAPSSQGVSRQEFSQRQAQEAAYQEAKAVLESKVLPEATKSDDASKQASVSGTWGRAQHGREQKVLNEGASQLFSRASESSNGWSEVDSIDSKSTTSDETNLSTRDGSKKAETGTGDSSKLQQRKNEAKVRSVNAEFVEGLDDINKLFEGVDPPDELDVGAVGSSIQEVLMGKGAQIVAKRVVQGLQEVRKVFVGARQKLTSRFRREHGALVTREEVLRGVQVIWKSCQSALSGFRDLISELIGEFMPDDELEDEDILSMALGSEKNDDGLFQFSQNVLQGSRDYQGQPGNDAKVRAGKDHFPLGTDDSKASGEDSIEQLIRQIRLRNAQ
jgi:hypothetical protein